MHERVLISLTELAALMKTKPAVLIDTRVAANYAEAHLPAAVNLHEILTYLATSTPKAWQLCGRHLPKFLARLRNRIEDATGSICESAGASGSSS